jgi:glutaredoxin 3
MNDLPNLPENDTKFDNSRAKVEIYSWLACGYCVRAKRLLRDKGIAFIEYAIDGDEQARRRMMERASGRSSVPQIFINGQGIGGFLELHELECTGQLDVLLISGVGD